MTRHLPQCALLAALLAFAAPAAPARAQTAGDAPAAAPAAGEPAGLNCEASQTVAVARTRQTVLAVFVTPRQRDGKPDGFALRFQLPHGIDIPAGVRLRIDGKPAPGAPPTIQTSAQAGLYARTDLDAALLAALRKGAAMEVEVTAMSGASIAVPATLNGFSAIFAKLQ